MILCVINWFYGIVENNIKKKLLSKVDLTFKKAVEISHSMEAANKDVSMWEKQELNFQQSIRFKRDASQIVDENGSIKGRNSKRQESVESKRRLKEFMLLLWQSRTIKIDCKYKNYKCSLCLRVGHLKDVCKIKNNTIN